MDGKRSLDEVDAVTRTTCTKEVKSTSDDEDSVPESSDRIMTKITRLLNEKKYHRACVVLTAHRSGLIKRLKRLKRSALETVRWLNTDQGESTYLIKYDTLIANFVLAAAHPKVDASNLTTELIQLITNKTRLVSFLMDAILTNRAKRAQYWYNMIRGQSITCPIGVLTETVPGLLSLSDYMVEASQDDVHHDDEFQFKWLFRIGGFLLTSLRTVVLPYHTQLALNNKICDLLSSRLKQPAVCPSYLKSLNFHIQSAVGPITNDASTELFDMCQSSVADDDTRPIVDHYNSPSDRTVVTSLGLAASVSLWMRIDAVDAKNRGNAITLRSHGPADWCDEYLSSGHQIPLDQDTQLLYQLVYLSSEHRHSKGLWYQRPPSQLIQNDKFVIPKHGAILRWLYNGLRRSKWPVGTGVEQIKKCFDTSVNNTVYRWLIRIFDSDCNIEVFAALYIFKTPQSITLYETIQQSQGRITLPHVLVTIVMEYLSSQPGSGGEYDTAAELLTATPTITTTTNGPNNKERDFVSTIK